jgi:hypothetical protein
MDCREIPMDVNRIPTSFATKQLPGNPELEGILHKGSKVTSSEIQQGA